MLSNMGFFLVRYKVNATEPVVLAHSSRSSIMHPFLLLLTSIQVHISILQLQHIGKFYFKYFMIIPFSHKF